MRERERERGWVRTKGLRTGVANSVVEKKRYTKTEKVRDRHRKALFES